MRLLLVLVLLLSTVAQSPKAHTDDKQNAHPQVDQAANNQNASDTGKTPETQFYTYNNQYSEGQESPSKVSDYLLAAFTFALVVVSFMQWKVLRKHEEWMQKHDANLVKLAESAKRSADNEERTVRLTQRADVLLSDIEIRDGISLGRDTRIILRIQNYGPTRADEVKFDFHLYIAGVDKTGPPQSVPIVIGAGGSHLFTFPALGEVSNQAGIMEITSGKAVLQIGGRITYNDVFGTAQVAEYKAAFNPAAKSFIAEKTQSN